MIKVKNELKPNMNKRFAEIRDLPARPSFMQENHTPEASDIRRSQLTSMEKASTCRRNPRIATVR